MENKSLRKSKIDFWILEFDNLDFFDQSSMVNIYKHREIYNKYLCK